MSFLDLVWMIVIVASLQPLLARRLLALRRARAIQALEKRNGSRVITLIHRQEGLAFLGIPFGQMIDIEDSEAVIRAIEMTAPEVPIDLILHAPGGLVLATDQIARALAAHPGPVTVFVPHYAMSGGTLIALAADRIVMSPSAVLGPVDPQVEGVPAASLLAAVAQKDVDQVDDETLVLADVARKARSQVRGVLTSLLLRHLEATRAADVARLLSEGRWTHDFPIDATLARSLGLNISTDLPDEVRQLMRLYPQAVGRRPSVEYIPVPYKAPSPPPSTPRPVSPARAGPFASMRHGASRRDAFGSQR